MAAITLKALHMNKYPDTNANAKSEDSFLPRVVLTKMSEIGIADGNIMATIINIHIPETRTTFIADHAAPAMGSNGLALAIWPA